MKYIIETISTFHHVYYVEAETKEQAIAISKKADWNLDVHLGDSVIDVYEYNDQDHQRFKKQDPYMFEGTAYINADGYLKYKNTDGTDTNMFTSTEKFEEK